MICGVGEKRQDGKVKAQETLLTRDIGAGLALVVTITECLSSAFRLSICELADFFTNMDQIP